ncbi:DUF1501 domain-containing protein [Aquimarina agarivorans]|uniref:DUF1501 domain-containing protein n=1 Tax=Aquimarina agarivorans TaxID=980584 RepID=UPI000248FDB3|nr:DUF1501 domain-containing protein [Aquimarina agarivorans]
MTQKKHSRRTFIESLGLGCAHLGATTLLSGVTNLGLMGSAAAANRSLFAKTSMMDYKALVCVYLAGGNDSFNMLVPTDNDPYKEYQDARTNMAIPKADLLGINPNNTDGKKFGLHPQLKNIQRLFENGNAAFVANCGVLQEPTDLDNFKRKIKLPIGLFSHSHQADRWQTSLPREINQSVGWGGRMADVLQQNNSNQNLSMSISLSGTNTFQRGNRVQSYAIKNTQNGSTLIKGATNDNFYEKLKRASLDDILEVKHQNILKQAYSDVVSGSKNNSFEFDAALVKGTTITTEFPDSRLGRNLQMVARTIAARDILSVRNQTFFVSERGFDSHADNLESHGSKMGDVDEAVGAFYKALEEIGVANGVTLYTMSDFGRKLVPNGDGTDHAWGGNSLVVGGSVKGKNIFGQYPELYVGNPLDTGGGRLIPTTSADEYFAELALWFGASSSDLEYILPNIGNFWDYRSGGSPLGFLS